MGLGNHNYWGIDILRGMETGTISEQLGKELPGLKGFSERNLKNMSTIFEEWSMLDNYNSAVETAEFTQISHQGQLPNNFKKTISDQLMAYRLL